MANENAATIIIRNPHDITIGITNTDLYDIILLPQADGVADGGRVITVYNALQTDAGSIGGPSNNDSHDVYSLTLGKDDAYLAIGGNYVDNFEEKFAFTGYAPEGYCDNWHPGPIGDIVIDYDEDGNPYKVGENYSGSVTYMVDANYNVHHLAYSVANKENGAIRFSGNKGTLVLTAQNGAKNSADYTESKYNKYYDLTIDLSEFENVKEGDYLCYSVDGGEIKRVKVGAGNSVVISGDAEINQYSKVEWYVAGETKIGGTTKFDIPSYGESMAESLISQMFGSSSADRIPFFSVLDMVNNSQYSNMLGGPYDYQSALDAGADYMYISINGGEFQKLAVENGMVYIEGHEFKASDTFEWYFVSSNDVLTDTYTIAGIDTGLDISLSAFDRNLVTAGCKFVYKVDGVEQSAIEITEDHLKNAVSIGDNVAIKNGSKIEWYITDADGNRLTNTQVIENVKLADVQEFSAEYRKDQLRIDLTDFIARAGSFESYSVSYVVKNGGASYTKEVVITGDANGRYIFAVDDIGQNAVVDYQVFGKNGSSKKQIGEDYSATVTDGELVADESSISADIKTENSLTVDLSAYFKNEVTDFNDPKISYTFAGAKVVRDTDGRYIAEISGIDGDTEYKLQRHRKTSLGTDTATLFDDYRFNEEKQCFEAVDCVTENNNTAIDITGYLGTLGDVNMPYVVNEISFRVKAADGSEYTSTESIACKWLPDASGESGKWVTLDGSETIAFDLSDNLKNTQDSVISFDVSVNSMGTVSNDYYYYDRKVTYNGNFESTLNYYLGLGDYYYYDNFKHYYGSYSYNWITIEEALNDYSNQYVGLRVTVNYNHSEKVGEEEVVTVESMSFDFFDIGTLDGTYVKETIYKTIMKGLGLSPKEDGTYDETKLITFSLDLYTTAASGSEAVGKLHYNQNEVGQVVDYYRENEAVFDFTEIIEKSGGADDTYDVTLKDGRGNTVTDALERDANGRFILRIPDQSVGSDYEFSITGDVTVSGTIDNLGGAGIASISSDICKNQLSIDFNAYIKEFERESRGNRDIDTDKLVFNIYVDDVFSTSFKLVDDAVLNIDGVAAGEVKDIRIEIVKNDDVLDDETGKDIKAGIAYGEIDGVICYIYDLSSMIDSIKIDETSSYSLWVEVEGERHPLVTKTGSELKDLSIWIDKTDQTETLALLNSKEIKFIIGEKEEGKDFFEVIKSLTIDTRLIEKDGGIDFSALLSELDGKEYITGAADKNNIKYLIENITTGDSVTVSVTELDRIFENLGSIGDTFNVTVLEDNIILKDGDTWQVSGDDTSIVSIKTALNTQHIQKTDDKIALRSDSYGIFGGDFSTGKTGQLLYDDVTLPGDTKNYTIWAENTLVIESDLAGIIETNTNAINFGYRIPADHYAINDGTSRSVISVSVKAQNLELKNNFRADIDNRNSSESMAIAQKYTGENIYDENGELEGEDKTFRVAFNDTVNPCDGEYSKTTIFTTYDEEKKENVEVELKDIIGNPFVFNGNLYYETKEGMKEVEYVSTNGSYDDTAVDYRSDFIAGETYVAEYAEIYIQNEDGSWDYYGRGSIELISGVDYENGDLIRSPKTMKGDGLYFYNHYSYGSGWYEYGERYALRNNVDIVVKGDDGSLTKKTAKVLYKYDFYDVAIKKDSTPITGTWLSAYDYLSNTAADNKVENMGFDVAGTLSQKDGTWGGDINIETSDAYIGANWHYVAVHKDRAADIANAGNNKIGAYGLKVDGTADIRKIDQVALDNDGTYEGVKYQNPKITVAADDNTIEALAYNDKDTVDRAILSNSTVTAAAIYAGTLKIDTVTDKAFFDVRSNNNTFIFNRHSLNDVDIKGAGVKTYGIYANNATFRDFDGTIAVESLNNKIQYFDDNNGSASDYKNGGIVSAGIYVTGTLTSNCNLNGEIAVNAEAVAYGIYANNITVKGAIDTDMIVIGFGISAENTITAAGFTGEIYSVIGINSDLAESNVANDSFDIGGYINANVAFTSSSTINLRVSGMIEAVDSISGETNYGLGANENVITYYNNVANRDYVELTGTANVTGDIDLRKGINNYSISSNATFVGNILDSDGQANIVYHLEGTPDAGHITHTINSYDDQTIYSTNVITLNVNYAEIGKNYQLIKYDLADGDAEKYWRDREIAVMYQGRTVTFKLNKVVEQMIPDNLTGEYTVTGNGEQTVSIADVLAGKDFTFPETSGIQFGIEYYLLDDNNVRGYTTTEFDKNGNRVFKVSGIDNGQKIGYTIVSDGENHSYYTGETTFKDANGKEVTITGTFTTDTDIFSVELSGEDGVSLAPVTPIISFEKLAENEKAPAETVVAESKYDEKNDALTISWNHQTAAQYGLVEIYAYEVEYIVFDQDGKALSNSLATRVVGGNSLIIDGIDENMSVRWRIRLLGSSSASMSSGWSEWNTDNSALKVKGDAGKTAVSVVYDENTQTITLISKTAATINYTIYGADYHDTTAKDVVMIQKGDSYQLVISGVAADSEFRYQVANCLDTREYILEATNEGEESKLVQEIVGWQSVYSDSYHITDLKSDLSDPANKILISFDYSNFTSQVIDANYNERGLVSVVGSMAHISFESLESDIPIRNYIIEYCPVTELVTVGDVKAAGAESIDDYIANYLETIAANNNASIYTKTFTGTALDISEIQNQTYVYWRIKAVDANGYESDWVAGDTFRVWANAEGDKYIPMFERENEKKLQYSVVDLGYNPARSDNFENSTKLTGFIGWTKAEDADSGVKHYVIELTDKNSKKIVKTVGAEYITPTVVGGSYKIGKNDYDGNDTFQVEVDGVMVDASITANLDKNTQNITGYTLTWAKLDSEPNDGPVNIYKNDVLFRSDITSGDNGYTATIYDYLLDLNGLTASNYSYKVYAVDYFGNKSASFSGSFSVDGSDPSNLKHTLNSDIQGNRLLIDIYWNEASDDNELGIRYYAIRYREVGTDEWIETKIAQGNENYIVEEGEEGFIEGFKYRYNINLDSTEKKNYEYAVIAYDYFGNFCSGSGKFGSVDVAPPTGFFKPESFKSEVDVVYKMITVEKVVVDEEGNSTTVTETVNGGLDYATVRLSWDGEFDDNSDLRYVVEISDDKYFNSDKTYSFWTSGSEKYMNFNNSTPGRPAGIFEGMSTVYWRVTVADEYFNTSVLGATQSFTFTDVETGNAIAATGKPSAPFDLKINNSDMEDGVHTGKNISLTWRSNNEQLGVYSYNIDLIDNVTGKVVVSYSTVDKQEKQPTDIENIVTVIRGDGYSVMNISNLNEIFTKGNKLDDGNYTVRVSAVDGFGRVSEAGEVELKQDTTAPLIIVDRIKTYLLPAGTDLGGKRVAEFKMDWSDAVDEDSKDIEFFEIWQTTDDPAADDATWKYVTEVKQTDYSAILPISSTDTYYYKIVAYDAAGNRSSDDMWNYHNVLRFTPANAADGYNDSFAPATRFEFDADGRAIMPAKDFELTGRNDADCIYFKTGKTSESLTLTVNQLETVYGAASNIKLEIFKGSSNNLWKTFTVSGNGRVFNDLLLDADTTYYYRITAINNESVVAYNFVWDRAEMGGVVGKDAEGKDIYGFNTTDDSANGAGELSVDGELTKSSDWVGYGDKVDYKKLDIAASGKYNITLGGVASNVTLALVERTRNANGTYSEKTLSSVTAKESDLNGKTISNAILDANKEYYLKVTSGNANSVGTQYDVTIDRVAEFTEATTDDDVRSDAIALLDGEKNGWVGYGDATDFYRLEVGSNGGAYNFTIDHTGDDAEAVKLVVYELTGTNAKGAETYRTVKTVTLAKNAASISTGSLYLTGANGGTYYVEVTATGAAKAQNSDYTVKADGDILPGDEDGTSLDYMNELVGETTDWVGINDNADYYYIDAASIGVDGYYTLTLNGTNGNQIKAAIGYENPRGTFVALQTVTGAANSSNLMLSRKFTQADLDKLALDVDNDGNPDNKLIVKIFAANTTSANSDYTISWSENEIDNGDDALTKDKVFAQDPFGVISVGAAGAVKDGWVGLGDAADHMIVDINSNGYYCFNLSDVENNLTVNLYEVTLDADGNILSSAKKSSANATTSADGKLYWALDAGKNYAVGVNNGGAAKGLNSSYDLELEKVSTLANVNDQRVSVAEPKAYVLEVGADAAGVRSFELDNIKGGQIKVSIFNAATNKVVKTFTGADFLSFSYNFAEGNYMIKVEAADKNGFDKSFDLSFAERRADVNDVIIGKATDDDSWIEIDKATSITDGWVGLNDSTDFIRLALDGETGSYNIEIDGLDNNVVLSLLEVTALNNADNTVKKTKSIKSLTVNAAKGSGLLENMMLDSSKTYFVQVKASSTKGTGDSNYTLTLTQNQDFTAGITAGDDVEFDTDVVVNGDTDTKEGWVGFGDAKDCIGFGTYGASKNNYEAAGITVSLGENYTGTGDLKVEIVQHNIDNNKTTVVKTMTLSSKAMIAHFGDMLLDANSQYSIRVTAPKAANGVNAEYSVTVDQYKLSDFVSGDNVIGNAQEFTVGEIRTGAVWLTSAKDDVDDNVDFYTITVEKDGNYTFDLAGISGSNIKITIGTENPKGTFKSLQSVTGVAGKDELILTRNLAAGTYLVKVENTGANKASRYELTATRNEDEPGFNTGDDTWQLVADNTESASYGEGDSITDWVGLGDASDVFKVNLDANGQVTFECDDELQEAIAGKGVSVTLLDSTGKSVALTYDSATGVYTSKNILCAGVDYYLNVKNSNTAKFSTDYTIGIAIK